jgi:PAS domain-containing protein
VPFGTCSFSAKLVLWNGKKEWQILYNDITERVQAEETLKASEEKYSTLIEQSSDGILILVDRMIVFANRRVNEMTGFAQIEILGKDITERKQAEEALKGYRSRISATHWIVH